MKATKVFLIVFVFVLIFGFVPVNAAITPPEVVNLPYTTENVDTNEIHVVNLSTAFVGSAEIPLISYTRTDYNSIRYAHLATQAVPGNCGPNNNWVCSTFSPWSIVHRSLSNVATERYGANTFGLAWAFSDNSSVVGLKLEFSNDMEFVGRSDEFLVDIDKFGGTLIGAPSIALVGGKYRLAAVFRDNSMQDLYRLVYMHFVGGEQTSCKDAPSGYRCDTIDAVNLVPIYAPSLAYVAGDVGISYVLGIYLRYAYPWTGGFPRPANCGPGGNTWRCIDIYAPEGGVTVGDRVAMAYGSDSTHAEIVYSTHTTEDNLNRASYRGSGGNCGLDGMTLGLDPKPIYRWLCNSIGSIDDINETSFGVAFDPNDYPVISWNNKRANDETQRLYIAYPGIRGMEEGTFTTHVIDGNDWSSTGHWNDISINSAGLTFLGYMQPAFRSCGEPTCEPDPSPNLKVAMQWFRTSLPLITR